MAKFGHSSRKPKRIQKLEHLASLMAQAEQLLDKSRAEEAITLLEANLSRYRRTPEVHVFLGIAYGMDGQLWESLSCYEKALDLNADAMIWPALASVYLTLEMHIHALKSFRQVIRRAVLLEGMDDAIEILFFKGRVADFRLIDRSAAGRGLAAGGRGLCDPSPAISYKQSGRCENDERSEDGEFATRG